MAAPWFNHRQIDFFLQQAVIVHIRITGVAEAVLIPVLLRIVGDILAVIADVAEIVVVGIFLQWIDSIRAVILF